MIAGIQNREKAFNKKKFSQNFQSKNIWRKTLSMFKPNKILTSLR